MIKQISNDFNDGNVVLLRTSSDFKKDATFNPNAEYLVIQDKKVLGVTNPNGPLTSKNAKLNEQCFPGLKVSGLFFKKVNAGIWCFKKEFSTSTSIIKVFHGIKVQLHLAIKFKLIDTRKAMQFCNEISKDLWISQKTFKNFFDYLSDDVLSALCKVIVNKGGSYFHKNNFGTYTSVTNKKFNDYGYEVVIEDIIDQVLSGK